MAKFNNTNYHVYGTIILLMKENNKFWKIYPTDNNINQFMKGIYKNKDKKILEESENWDLQNYIKYTNNINDKYKGIGLPYKIFIFDDEKKEKEYSECYKLDLISRKGFCYKRNRKR